MPANTLQNTAKQAAKRKFVRRILFWLGGSSGVVGLHWLSTGLEELLEHVWEWLGHHLLGSPTIAFIAAAFVLILAGLVIAHLYRDSVTGAKLTNLKRSEQHKRPCLILIVSPEDFKDPNPRLQMDDPLWKLDGTDFLNSLVLPQDAVGRLKEAIKKSDRKPNWPWQHTLRAILPHIGTVKTIWLVGSKADLGSFRQLPRLRDMLNILLGDSVKILIEAETLKTSELTEEEADKNNRLGCDFEDFDDLSNRLDMLIHRIAVLHGYRGHQLVIDATGGQKTASIAAASVTLKSDSVFQYVSTTPPAYDVMVYDVQFISDQHSH